MKKILYAALVASLAACSAQSYARRPQGCNRVCTPAEWQSMTVRERADSWSEMTRENRMKIWSSMDDADRQALREELRPISREEMRRHIECSLRHGREGAMEPGHLGLMMSPGERRHMRHQIIQVHQEYVQSYQPEGSK